MLQQIAIMPEDMVLTNYFDLFLFHHKPTVECIFKKKKKKKKILKIIF